MSLQSILFFYPPKEFMRSEISSYSKNQLSWYKSLQFQLSLFQRHHTIVEYCYQRKDHQGSISNWIFYSTTYNLINRYPYWEGCFFVRYIVLRSKLKMMYIIYILNAKWVLYFIEYKNKSSMIANDYLHRWSDFVFRLIQWDAFTLNVSSFWPTKSPNHLWMRMIKK